MPPLSVSSFTCFLLSLLFLFAAATSDSSSSSSTLLPPSPYPTSVTMTASSSSMAAVTPSAVTSGSPTAIYSSTGGGGAPPTPPDSNLPVVYSTRGCDDDSCPDCPQTQQCQGSETLTMIGRDFCVGAVVELSISQYSSVARCHNYRVSRSDDRQATCMVPDLPNAAWSSPAQIYVSLRCPGEDSTALFPALTYRDTFVPCATCTPDTKRRNWLILGASVGAVVLLCAVCGLIRRRRMALRQQAAASASGGVMASVPLPQPVYVPLVEQPAAVYSAQLQYHQQPLPHQGYAAVGAPYSAQHSAFQHPQHGMYGPHVNLPYRTQY